MGQPDVIDVLMDRDEEYPVFYVASRGGVLVRIDRELWDSYGAALETWRELRERVRVAYEAAREAK